jgi:hypothetical protein
MHCIFYTYSVLPRHVSYVYFGFYGVILQWRMCWLKYIHCNGGEKLFKILTI